MAGIFFKFSGDGNGNGEGILHQGDGVRSAKKPEVSKIAEAKIAPLIKEGDVVIEKKRDSVIETVTAENESKEKGENVLEEKFKTIFSKERIAGVKFESEKGGLRSPGRQIHNAFFDNGALVQLMQGFFDEKQKQLEDPYTASDVEILQFCIDHLHDIKSKGKSEDTKRAIRAICEKQLSQDVQEHVNADDNLNKKAESENRQKLTQEIDSSWKSFEEVHDQILESIKNDQIEFLNEEHKFIDPDIGAFFEKELEKVEELAQQCNAHLTEEGDIKEYTQETFEFIQKQIVKIQAVKVEHVEFIAAQKLKNEQNRNAVGSDNKNEEQDRKKIELSKQVLEEQEFYVDRIKEGKKTIITNGGVLNPISEKYFQISELIDDDKKSFLEYIATANEQLKEFSIKFTLESAKENCSHMIDEFSSMLVDDIARMKSDRNKKFFEDTQKLLGVLELELQSLHSGENVDRQLKSYESLAHKIHDVLESYEKQRDLYADDEREAQFDLIPDGGIENTPQVAQQDFEAVPDGGIENTPQVAQQGFENVPEGGIENIPQAAQQNFESVPEGGFGENTEREVNEIEVLFEKAKSMIMEKTQSEMEGVPTEKVFDNDIRTTFDELLEYVNHHDKLSPVEESIWNKVIGVARKISQTNSIEQYVVVDGETFKVVKDEQSKLEKQNEKLPLELTDLFERYAKNVARVVEDEFFGEDKMFSEETSDAERRAFISMCLRKKIAKQIENQKNLLDQYQFDKIDATMLVEKLLEKALTQK